MSIESTGDRLLDCAKVILKCQSLPWDVALDRRELRVRIKDVTTFSISWMPECPRVVIFHSVSVDPVLRNQGKGTFYHDIRLKIALLFGATTAICTVNASNRVEKHILEKAGWQFVASVNPPNTELWSKQI